MSKFKRKKEGYTLAGNLPPVGMVVLVILILSLLSGCGADMPAASSVPGEPVQSQPQQPVTPPETPQEPPAEPEKPDSEPAPAPESEKPAAESAPTPEPEKPAAESAPAPEPEKPAAEPAPAPEPEPEKPADEPAPAPEPGPEPEKGPMVIGNKNSKKYHELGCSSITDMKESNRIEIESAAVAEAKGYKPCARCH